MGTAVVSVVLIGIVSLIIRKMVRDKKNGKSLQCGCSDCGGHCGKEKVSGEGNTIDNGK